MRTALVLLVSLAWASDAPAQPATPERPTIAVPRLDGPPEFDDFLDMEPSGARQRRMARVEGFTQRWPADGDPERQRTVAYLGYTDEALHVVYVAFDSDPGAVRAHLVRREDVFNINDDVVELRLDTFADRRRSYYFVSNPLGVQLDADWPEVGGQYDESFDAVWHSHGQRTPQGFVVWMAIPFKSLRFRPGDTQAWGFYLGRWIPRSGEWNFWPRVSNRQQSFLSQMATLEGLRGISNGRGLQLIPYATYRGFKALDARDPSRPRFERDRIDPAVGLDAKMVVRDALVLDMTANPDFSQVESDAPQITTNQRFEVFFPEKRPFFLENAGFLQTPINLLFTRRIADPQVGAKLTGKAGGWGVGALVADDRAPGLRVAPGDPLSGARAWSAVGRISRDIFGQSSVGGIVTRRALPGRTNWVAGADTRLRLSPTWLVDAQAVASGLDRAGAGSDGRAYRIVAARTGRTFQSRTAVLGVSPSFVTDLGFVPRTDAHEIRQTIGYTWRPAGTLTDWGPTVDLTRVWAWDGTGLDWSVRPALAFNFTRSTGVSVFAEPASVGLRPGDAPGVSRLTRFRPDTWGATVGTSPRPSWTASMTVTGGEAVNFRPARGAAPALGDLRSLRVDLGLRPHTALRNQNTWLRTSLDEGAAAPIFTTDIVRSQWAWQFTREWSVRVIGQWEHVRAQAARTTIAPRRNVNADVLLTYLVNPWTALYVGYNGNLQNLELDEGPAGAALRRRAHGLTVDAWQVFIKWSHLLRF